MLYCNTQWIYGIYQFCQTIRLLETIWAALFWPQWFCQNSEQSADAIGQRPHDCQNLDSLHNANR